MCQRRAHPSAQADVRACVKGIPNAERCTALLDVVEMLQADWQERPESQMNGGTDRQIGRQTVCLAADVVWLENLEVSV